MIESTALFLSFMYVDMVFRLVIGERTWQYRYMLLAALSPKSYEHLTGYCTPVVLPTKSELYVAHELPRYAYFMTSGLASIVTTTSDGQSSEVGMVGREGIVGAMNLLGPRPAPTNCLVQLEATALRISLRDLRTVFDSSQEIRDRILEMLQEQGVQSESDCRLPRSTWGRAQAGKMVADNAGQDRIGSSPGYPGIPGRDARSTTHHRHGYRWRVSAPEADRIFAWKAKDR